MRRRRFPVSQGRFICVQTTTGYLDVTLNGNVVLIAVMDEARNVVRRKNYEMGDVTRKHLHDGRGWNISLLLVIAEE